VDKLSLTFAALADPTRRAILDRLLRGDATVNDLAKPFDLRLPTVSKHLKVLQRAGLVSQSRKGNWRPRRLESAPLEEVARWAERFRANRQDQPRQKFLCLICADRLLEQMSEAEAKKHLAQYRALTGDLRKRGQLVACNRLLPADTATTVRVRKGRVSDHGASDTWTTESSSTRPPSSTEGEAPSAARSLGPSPGKEQRCSSPAALSPSSTPWPGT